jgi:ABC-type glycerol-3-phosphate transport system substrate-binding protein
MLVFFLFSCRESKTAVLWTDRPEFAFYVQCFNSVQSKYKIEIKQFDSLALTLSGTKESPDIIVGRWLKSSKIMSRFKPLDTILKQNPSLENDFFPSLLSLGAVGKKQMLLPVAFDLPLIFFAEEKNLAINDAFIIDLNEIKELGKEYNVKKNSVFTQVGFSPLWNNDFVFEIARIKGAAFTEGETLEWNNEALENAILFIKDWINNINGGVDADADFSYKYFFNTPQRLVLDGRILFSYIRSSDFFTKTEQRSDLDFRILSGEKLIPVYEGAVYYGLDKKGKSSKAAEAFTLWFFNEKTQERLLEESRLNHIDDTVFGIAGGFPAMKSVTKNILPRYYPELLGHFPPDDYLMPSNIKPYNWTDLKESVIIPYILEQCKNSNGSASALGVRVADWIRTSNTIE